MKQRHTDLQVLQVWRTYWGSLKLRIKENTTPSQSYLVGDYDAAALLGRIFVPSRLLHHRLLPVLPLFRLQWGLHFLRLCLTSNCKYIIDYDNSVTLFIIYHITWKPFEDAPKLPALSFHAPLLCLVRHINSSMLPHHFSFLLPGCLVTSLRTNWLVVSWAAVVFSFSSSAEANLMCSTITLFFASWSWIHLFIFKTDFNF